MEDGKNGILYPNDRIKDLESAIKIFISDENKILGMKYYCVKSAEKYQPDKYIAEIINSIR